MIKRNLFKTKRCLAIILTATLVMSHGVTTLAEVTGEKIEANTREGSDNDKEDNDQNVTKTADSAVSDDSNSAVDARSYDGHEAVVNIKDDVTTDSHTETGNGIYASSSDEGSSTSVTVGGDVSVETDLKDSDVESSSAIHATAIDHSSVNISVGGDVSSTTHGSGGSTGIAASAGGDSTNRIEVGGNVTSDSKFDGEGTYGHGSSIGITTSPSDGDVSIKVGGDVTSNSASGTSQTINVSPQSTGSGNEHSVKIEVGGDVTSTSANDMSRAIGITPIQTGGGNYTPSISVDVGRDVIATNNGNGDSSYAYGIYACELGDSDVSIEVGGDVKSKSNGGAETIQIDDTNGKLKINVVGDVIQEGKAGQAIGLGDGSGAADIDVSVGGDVVASTTAVNLFKSYDESTVDLVVKGTIKGENHSIVLNTLENGHYDEDSQKYIVGETIEPKTSNLNITVWKVDTSKTDGKIVEHHVGNNYKQDDITEKVEKNINYIIKIDGSNLDVNKSKDSHGLYTAKQDEEVFLKVDIPSGYALDHFYNAEGAANVSVLQDSSGNYYLKVPRGGGVYVGVKLKQTDTATSGDNSGSTNDSTNNSPTGSPTDNSSTNTQADSRTSYSSPSDSSSGGSGGGSDSSSSSAPGSPASAPQTYTEKLNDVVSALASMGIDTTNLFFVQSVDAFGNTISSDISSVLTPVDRLTAINNFMEKNAPTMGLDNFKGAGVVSLSSYFTGSATDTVSVPVVSDVVSGQTYTVIFSDGTTMTVPCSMNGVLNIPFTKSAEGLTFIIYGTSLDPSLAMQQMIQQPTA